VGADEEELKRLGIGFPDNGAERLDEAWEVRRLAHIGGASIAEKQWPAQAGP
jgi:hypothetical protein